MNWEKVRLGEVIQEPISGEWGEDGVGTKVIRNTNFTNEGRLDLTNVAERSIDPRKVLKKKLVAGDVIIEKSGGSPTQPVGRVVHFMVDDGSDYVCSNFTSVLRANEKVNSRYFFWFLFFNHASKKTLSFQNKTTGIINLQLKRYVEELEIPLPPLPVQQKIAALLDAADAVRQKDKALLAKYDALLQSTFHQLFGDPVQNEKGWEVKKLRDCVKFKGGGTPNTKNDDYFQGDILWVSPKDMKSRIIVDTIDKITQDAVDNSTAKLIPAGSVLLVVRSGILKKTLPVAIAGVDLTINQDMKALLCNEDLNNYFVAYLLDALSPVILKSVRGTTADNISSDFLRDISIPLPPLSLQAQFAEIAQNIQRQKALVKEAAAKSEALFQSLLHHSFAAEA